MGDQTIAFCAFVGLAYLFAAAISLPLVEESMLTFPNRSPLKSEPSDESELPESPEKQAGKRRKRKEERKLLRHKKPRETRVVVAVGLSQTLILEKDSTFQSAREPKHFLHSGTVK